MAIRPKYISLFSGAGGLELAIRLALPESQCVCYVEREVEAAGILAARFADKTLDDAPVWSDVSTFDGKPWRGLVDGIAGGFPCQDLSVAGKREGIKRGNRSGLWYQYARIIREVEPRWVYIENVPPVLAFPAGGIVLGELAAMGFDAEWGTLRASDVGASHRRKRCFVLAYRSGRRCAEERPEPKGIEGRSYAGQPCVEVGVSLDRDDPRRSGIGRGDSPRLIEARTSDSPDAHGEIVERSECAERRTDIDSGSGCIARFGGEGGTGKRSLSVAHAGCDAVRRCTECTECTEEIGRRSRAAVAGSGCELGHSDNAGLEGRRQLTGERTDERIAGSSGSGMVFAPGPASAIWNDVLVRDYGMRPALSQEEAESCLRRVADGMANPLDQRINRLRACGNGVVPLQGAAALTELIRRIAQ